MKKSILVVAAHPDDEVLGCGGTIAKLSNKGFNINVVFLSDGESSRENLKNIHKLNANRRSNAKKALNILGCNSIEFLDYPDNRLDSIDLLDIVKEIEKLIDKFKPQIIFTHYMHDLNIDHQIAHKAVITASRPQPNHIVNELIFFEIPSSTEWNLNKSFMPNYFVDISNTLTNKIKALKYYQKEMRPYPHPRSIKSIKNLSYYRGTTIGCKSAEAFIIGRKIEKN